MGETTDFANRNQLGVSYDFSKIFVFDNKYRKINIANATGNPLVLTAGMPIGTISATGKGAVLASGSTDGSQIPTGILAEDITIADGTNEDVTICIGGKVAEEKLTLNGTDTLATSITDQGGGTRILRDRLACDTLGIELVSATELTKIDNI
jgi:hypothetical protein